MASKAAGKGKRAAVSDGLTPAGGTYERPAGAETPDEKQQAEILKAIETNVLFMSMEPDIRLKVVGQMHAEEIPAQKDLIVQGENGDLFYVVSKGGFDIIVGGNKVDTFGVGRCFGELALMYNSPRAATVRANQPCKVWVLHRLVYRQVTRDEFSAGLNQYEEFLKKVPLLQPLGPNERQKLAEALEPVEYSAGQTIFEQGSMPTAERNAMYIVRQGKVEIFKDKEKVMTCQSGDAFGERALLKQEPRAATCIAATDVSLLEIQKATFDLILGPLEATLSSRLQSYDSTGGRGSAPAADAANKDHFTPIPFEELTVIGTLGCGSFGHVQLVYNTKDSNQTFALKAVSKAQIVETGQQGHIMSEKQVMEKLNHPFLIRLYQTYKDQNKLYFLLEPVMGGELFTLLKEHNVFEEGQARIYAGCVVLAFEYMHSFDIVYRDLKPENLLIDDKGYIKITDFGFAKRIESGRTWTLCGTPDYLAPEIVAGKGHGKGVDWWTLGILIYEMLCSAPPFYDKDQLKTYQKIMGGEIVYPSYFSSAAISLIKKLLYRKAARRLGVVKGGASLIKKHKWFKDFHQTYPDETDGWNQLLKRALPIDAQFIPTIASNKDLSNFDDAYEEDMNNTPYQPDGTDWDKDF